MKTAPDTARLDQPALEAALRAGAPNVRLAPPWLLQAVIAHELGLMPTGLNVPDEQLLVVRRSAFLKFIEDQELPVPEHLPEADELILLQKPDEAYLDQTPPGDVLLHYWRLLARATIESRVRHVVGASPDPAVVRAEVDARIDRVGPDVFNEARHVLYRENRLTSSPSDLDVYAKFVAAFTELRHFAPRLLEHVFPSIEDTDAMAAAVGLDLGGDRVGAVRPAGTPQPSVAGYQPLELPPPHRGWWYWVASWVWPRRRQGAGVARHRAAGGGGRGTPRDRKAKLNARADKAAAVGNVVRAAILRGKAHRGDRTDLWFVPGAAAREIDKLVARLRPVLGLDDAAAAAWRDALRPLVGPATLAWWSPEGRLLYDLQTVCDDHERVVHNTGVVEWLLELCRRPLFRPLPKQRLTLIARHLASAAHRLVRCRLTAQQRARLDPLLHAAAHDAEHHLRDDLVPVIGRAFDDVGIVPRHAVDVVARRKMAHEMVDVVLRDGYLNFPGVRDAISRNVTGCDDLRGPAEWFGYDQLMKLDRRLGDALDGVYHRGEIYRYVFQKFSSWLFASRPSRTVSKVLVMPAVGAVILVAGFQFTILHLLKAVAHVDWQIFPEHRDDFDGQGDLPMWMPTIGMAVFLLLVINWPAFRRGTKRAFAWFFRQVGFVLFELPERVFKTPAVRWLLNSRAVRLAFRYGVKPLVWVMLVWWAMPHDASPVIHGATFLVTFLVVNLLVNSRPGRAAEQAVIHALRVGWVRFTADKIAYAVRGTMRFFERLLEAADRMLYAVDEWLRFRGGGGRRSLVGKAALGVVWFYVAYVFRFALNLLVEPQVNPIKHFPVVTVSHKLLLPLIPQAAGVLQAVNVVATRDEALAVSTTIIFGIPGIFGFLAWELKENWKLYRANLPATLRPVHFGSHGESVAQLLRPGFHSGTLPKAYAKLRNAHRYNDANGLPQGMEHPLAVYKPIEAVDHVAESVRHFVERAWLALLNRHPAFAESPVVLADLTLGAARIVLDFAVPASGPAAADDDAGALRVEIEQVNGWIVAGVRRRGWAASLPAPAAAVFDRALRGFYRMAAVDVVREDVDAAFAPRAVRWELRAKSLVVRPADAPGAPAEYRLHEQTMEPRYAAEPPIDPLPMLDEKQVLFRAVEIPWAEWVGVWRKADEAGAVATDEPAIATNHEDVGHEAPKGRQKIARGVSPGLTKV